METIELANETVKLDPRHLQFNEQTLSAYLQTEAGYYNNFGAKLALAEKLQQIAELEYETMYAETFRYHKDTTKCSDKMAEAHTESESTLKDAKLKSIEARYNVRLLQQHLRAWDKNHENAQSMGHNIRKEMDKINNDIRVSGYSSYSDKGYEDALDQMITHVDPTKIASE